MKPREFIKTGTPEKPELRETEGNQRKTRESKETGIIFDTYHFGPPREESQTAQVLFEVPKSIPIQIPSSCCSILPLSFESLMFFFCIRDMRSLQAKTKKGTSFDVLTF